MLQAETVSFRYAPRLPWVIQDVSLAVAPGEIVGLSGPSGRGKTTLARLLAGYLEPTHGRVVLRGQPLPRRGPSPVQLVFQHPELAINPRWRIGRVLAEGPPPGDRPLQLLGVERGWFDRWPHELSGGELQRICVARALGPPTTYLIADEMTAMLDALTQAQLWDAIVTAVRDRGLGVLAISHNPALLRRVSGRVLSLGDPQPSL